MGGKIIKYGFWILIAGSLWLSWHNIMRFNPDYGFDGKDHQMYIRYIISQGKLPLPHEGWETNQPPLYYLLGALAEKQGWPVQFINGAAFYVMAVMWYLFTKSKLAVLAYLALPMANIFPPMITNELSGSMLVVFCLLVMVFKPDPKLLIPGLILGFYTKYTVLTLLPLVPLAYGWKVKKTLVTYALFALAASPILIRDYSHYKTLLPLANHFFEYTSPRQQRGWSFWTNGEWILKRDTFNAGNYSFSGGLWDTFWLDGFQVITPVVEFHKKALVLWGLGFPLIGISGWGLVKLAKTDKRKAVILGVYIAIAIGSIAKYNLDLPYKSIVKAFYAFGLIVPYILGLAEAAKNKRVKFLTAGLLIIQEATMVSYFAR